MSRPIAIITARGGSKRIPKKNIRKFCGKSIIAYSIEAAVESGLFEDVMVSTDSEEIAGIAKEFGASVPFMRSEKTSNDLAGTEEVLAEVVSKYKERGIEFDSFCCIYPTAPFITADKLIESYKLLEHKDTYSVIPMVSFSFPPQRGMRMKENGLVEPVDIDGLNARSQDLPVIYHDAGQFYWIKTKEFLVDYEIMGSHTRPYIVPETEVQDIDNETDWQLAEMKYKFMTEKKV